MFVGTLHGYQDQGVERAVERGSLLIAHGMGTGKTLTAIGAVEELLARSDVAGALIIVPASLKWQWAQRIAQFADVQRREITLKGTRLTVPTQEYCVVVDGSPAQRERAYRAMEMEHYPDYVIVSYESATADLKALQRLTFDVIVLDEAQAIKNASAARSKKIKKLTARYRFALTGTPMDNGKPEEIYSIMQWVDPSVFGRWDLFDRAYVVRNKYGRPVGYKNLDVLHRVLAPAMDRRTVRDPEVAACMPRVVHERVDVHMDETTRRVYARIEQDLTDALERAREEGGAHVDVAALYLGGAQSGSAALGRVSTRMLAARLLLCHPQLLRISADKHLRSVRGKSGIGSAYAEAVRCGGWLEGLEGSEKLTALAGYVEQALADPGAKVIVFTAFREMLALLEQALDRGPGACVRYHGELDAAARAAAIARFCEDPGCRVFISTDAGGSGVDLPVASHVVNYDPPASVGAWQQRNTRHTRANSVHALVRVADLVTVRSIEEHAHARLSDAQQVARAGVDDDASKRTHARASLSAHLHETRAHAWSRTGERRTHAKAA
jgi:SNF2 family DNA or RNA helicase